ncbi:unnamed protein product [Sphenostylis stenocarpa]|uniref:Uncharacterized protein n=1 Tax=Sphenostylis stenocarpa TaxID=92480 RepID=A0AA86W5T7_9FABA|nr:unnamed protein product [Sphenostylis stenocarpa]
MKLQGVLLEDPCEEQFRRFIRTRRFPKWSPRVLNKVGTHDSLGFLPTGISR